jgi:antitoxin (DNA-binding transcriptional repressor) of toxin-antitoxin stability system
MRRVDLKEAETRLAELIDEVAEGEDVIITRSNGVSFKFDNPLEDFKDYEP